MVDANQSADQRKALDLGRLMDAAKSAADLSDFGPSWFMEPMARHLGRAATELDFTPDGLGSLQSDVVRYLVNRLRVQRDITLHPEILEEDVSDPLIIIGLPRSGTTKLQRILAAAPETQKLYLWRMLNPAPFPHTPGVGPDPRISAMGMESMAGEGNAAVQAAHEMAAGLVEEEFILFDHNCNERVTGITTRVPLFYCNWTDAGDGGEIRHSYDYVKTLLQYLQWQDGGKRGRPWIMKAVIHLPHMDALLRCFPKSTLVHCHRAPVVSIPSVAKVMWSLYNQTARIDKATVAQGFLTWGAAAMRRYMESRARLQLDRRILDVRYDDIRDKVMDVVGKIYAHAGWTMSDDAREVMVKWDRNNEQGKLGRHVYSLEEFGLTEEGIRSAFAAYIERYVH